MPDAVLVGGAAAALYAGHRDSFDHGHVLADLQDRYAEILEAVEATDGWVTSVRASAPPMTIMGSLGGIEAGLRQLRRTRPLEVQDVDLGEAGMVRAPTAAEILRVKAYLVVQRNQVRDYLDVVALTARYGPAEPAGAAGSRRLLPRPFGGRGLCPDRTRAATLGACPRDTRVTRQLTAYKGLKPAWHDWGAVVAACHDLADALLDLTEAGLRQ